METVKAQLKQALVAFPQTLAGGEVQFTTQARRVLELAIQSGRDVDDDGIGVRHLLFGLLKVEQSSAARILKAISRLEARLPATPTLDLLGAMVGEFPQRGQ